MARAAFLRSIADGGEAEAQALYGQLLLDGNGGDSECKGRVRLVQSGGGAGPI